MPIVEAMTHMGMFLSSLCALIVVWKRAGMGLDEYSSKQILFLMFFVF